MNPILCIYHANCLDGFTSAWIVHRAMPSASFHEGMYGEVPPDCKGRDVIFVDFCYKAETMQRIVDEANSVIVLDHHKSAVPELEKVTGIREKVIDMGRSGAMITWDYFNPKRHPPLLVQFVQDRDLWRFFMDDTKAVCALLFMYPQTLQAWDEAHHALNFDYRGFVAKGELLVAKHQKDVEDLIRLGKHRITILGHDVPAVNCAPTHASDVGNLLAPGEPFAAMYQFVDGVLACSLRSTDEGIDVSEIASSFGGGGHRNAAGFKISLPVQELFEAMLNSERHLPELNLYRIPEAKKKTVASAISAAKAVNDKLQAITAQPSTAWHRHETIDDQLFDLQGFIEGLDEEGTHA